MKTSGFLALLVALSTSVLAAPVDSAEDVEIVERGNLPDLSATQSAHARSIIAEVKKQGVGMHGCETAITTGLTESSLRILANNKVPASLKYAHDGLGADHDSIGIFQQRAMYYKDIACDMKADCSAGLFLDVMKSVKGWQSMDVAALCQRVQQSGVPSAYKKFTATAASVCKAGM